MTDVADHLAELALLVPALGPALLRDRGAGDGTPHGSKNLQPAPHNHDVQVALTALDRELPALVSELAETLDERPTFTTLEHALRDLAAYHLLVSDAVAEALRDHVTSTLTRWVELTRRALRLSEPPRPLGTALCPHHASEPVSLLVGGSEAALDVTRRSVTWTYDATVFCPACGATWTMNQWHALSVTLAATDPVTLGSTVTPALSTPRARGLADAISLSRAYGVRAGTIRQWAARGLLKRHGKDRQGRTLHSVTEFEELLQERDVVPSTNCV